MEKKFFLSEKEFLDTIKCRGWTVRQVAIRWGIGDQWLRKIAKNTQRKGHWNDALAGLPIKDDSLE